MAERLTADEAWNTLHVASGSNVWHLLSLSSKSDVDRWFNWLRDRFVAEVRAEIDPLVTGARRERDEARREREYLVVRNREVHVACSNLSAERDTLAARVKELEADRDRAVDSLCEEATGRLDAEKELARLKADIADEADCVRESLRDALREALERENGELEDLVGYVRSLRKAFDESLEKTKWVHDRKDWGFPVLGMHRADVMRRKIEELEAARDRVPELLESLAIAQNDAASAKARIRELEAATAKPAPKPRRTGGRKVRDWLENHVDHCDHRINDEAFEAFAKKYGIPDDPEPPSDAELMRKASEASDGSTSAYWSQCAAEFLKLRAERDGGGA